MRLCSDVSCTPIHIRYIRVSSICGLRQQYSQGDTTSIMSRACIVNNTISRQYSRSISLIQDTLGYGSAPQGRSDDHISSLLGRIGNLRNLPFIPKIDPSITESIDHYLSCTSTYLKIRQPFRIVQTYISRPGSILLTKG